MSEDNKPTRRIVRPISIEVTSLPTLEELMNDATSIIGAELAQYKAKTKRGSFLSLKEARAVQGYLDVLVKISRESREQIKSEDLSSISNEDLLDMAAKLAKVSNNKDIDKK